MGYFDWYFNLTALNGDLVRLILGGKVHLLVFETCYSASHERAHLVRLNRRYLNIMEKLVLRLF